MEQKTTECETVISVTADGLYSNAAEIAPPPSSFLDWGPMVGSPLESPWRPKHEWTDHGAVDLTLLVALSWCCCSASIVYVDFFFFFNSPWNLPKVRVLILWIIFLFFFFQIRQRKEEARGTKTRRTLNCTLICERAVKIVSQEPHKQRRQEPSFLFLLPLLCTFSFFSPSTSFWCERIWC